MHYKLIFKFIQFSNGMSWKLLEKYLDFLCHKLTRSISKRRESKLIYFCKTFGITDFEARLKVGDRTSNQQG